MINKRKLNSIEVAALRIAASMALKPSGSCINGRWTGTGYVSWDYVMQLRQELEVAGVDWKAIHKLFKQEQEEDRKRLADKYRGGGETIEN
jgi:hypothetical protein